MSVSAPLQNPNYRFALCRGKMPVEQGWPSTANYPFFHPTLCLHQYQWRDYGVLGGYGKLGIGDFDSAEVQAEVLPQLPETFSVLSGGKGLLHVYFLADDCASWKVLDGEGKTLFDFQGWGKMVIGPGSIHPDTGRPYLVWLNKSIAPINTSYLKGLFLKYQQKTGGEIVQKQERASSDKSKKLTNLLALRILSGGVTMVDLLEHYGVPTNRNPTQCPFHSSVKGRCFSFTETIWHCFHCERGGHVADFIKMMEGLA